MDFPFYTPKDAFPVGGAVRDLLLGRRPTDLDYAALDPEGAAEEAKRRLGGSLFPLDPKRGHYRLVVGEERSEERRVGKECSEPCRSRWSPYH